MNVEKSSVPMLVLDADRVVVEASPAIGAMIGTGLDEIVGKHIHDTLRPRTPTGVDLLVDGWDRGARLGKSCRLNEQDVLLKHASGGEVAVSVGGGYCHDDSGTLTGAVIFVRRCRRGPRRPRSGVRIVSAVSHELRSPLTSLRGYTSLLLKQWDTVGDDDRKSMLQQIDRDARRVSRMIGELLDIARLEMGRVPLNRVEFDIAKLSTDVIDNVRMAYDDCEVDLQAPNGLQVWADPDKISQVLTNLIENACKYASPKGIVLRIAESQDDNLVVGEVIDHGPGIPQADLNRLFEQFFQSSQGRPTGTGLGLWISRGLVEAHGGTLTASSDGTNGSTFRFTLPTNAFENLHGRTGRSES
jgi:signal transduction histidine kinase